MPVRFQVDPDFYDHPKVTGMSDAAFSLWVRAGSFSAAKSTDGFVSEDVLAHTLRSSAQVADELVSRGLWRRRKGGYVFHQWEARNLTKARIEANRKADAERKRAARKAVSPKLRDPVDLPPVSAGTDDQNGRPNGTSQVNRPNVRPDSSRNPSAVQQESDRNPDVSVSVSVSSSSGSLGGVVTEVDARVDEPPTRCPKHRDDDNPPPCGGCAEARRTREAWQAERTAVAKRAHTTALERQAQARAIAVAGCDLCDDNGYVGRVLCDHDPDAADRAARGRAAVAAARARKGST
jgi:hypothetical protein